VQHRFRDELDTALRRLRQELAVDADWGLRPIEWDRGRDGLFVAAPRAAEDNGVVQDIRSDREAAVFGDLVARLVWHEMQDAEARVRLSLAGGRKTMSFHGGAAKSLFGPVVWTSCPPCWSTHAFRKLPGFLVSGGSEHTGKDARRRARTR
jgi:hypothetical protein